jgi:hypothetical protein
MTGHATRGLPKPREPLSGTRLQSERKAGAGATRLLPSWLAVQPTALAYTDGTLDRHPT